MCRIGFVKISRDRLSLREANYPVTVIWGMSLQLNWIFPWLKVVSHAEILPDIVIPVTDSDDVISSFACAGIWRQKNRRAFKQNKSARYPNQPDKESSPIFSSFTSLARNPQVAVRRLRLFVERERHEAGFSSIDSTEVQEMLAAIATERKL